MSVSEKTKRVFVGLVSVGIAISTFVLADMAMPDEVKWFMRWWLAGVALVCYFAGAAYAAYLMRERINEIENDHVDALKEKETTIAGKQAALDNEKRKNAELATRWEKLNSEERRKRETFDVLSEREKWCLSHVVDDWPKKHSASGSVILASYDVLTRAGILIDQGEEELHGQMAHTYTISLEWRKWVFNHSDELPEPNLKMPE